MIEKPPKRKRSAWFAFYPDDFAGGTRGMSLAAKGAFIDLLAYQFANGSIPLDDRTLCRIIGAFPEEWQEIRAEVLCKFEDEGGMLINRRMQKERDERNEIREKRIQAVNKRWNKTDTLVSDLNKQTGYKSNDLVYTSPSPSPSPSKKKETPLTPKGGIEFPADFSDKRRAAFSTWARYKREKGQTYKATGWQTLLSKFSHLSDDQVLASIESSMASNYAGIYEARGQILETSEQAPKPRRRLPSNWRETAEALWGHPVQCNEDELSPDQWADVYRNSR